MKKQLAEFRYSLETAAHGRSFRFSDWSGAFHALQEFLDGLPKLLDLGQVVLLHNVHLGNALFVQLITLLVELLDVGNLLFVVRIGCLEAANLLFQGGVFLHQLFVVAFEGLNGLLHVCF
jgi:hypothetical protein